MRIEHELQTLFTIPENHTPKVVISGGTDEAHFAGFWKDTLPKEVTNSMDANASKVKLPLSPVLILLAQGKDGHIDAIFNLPLQEVEAELDIEQSVAKSNDLRRITDWCGGFMEVFCMTDTTMALDLTTGQTVLGSADENPFPVTTIVKEIRPKREVRVLDSIGDVDDILFGQRTNEEIEKMVKKIPVLSETEIRKGIDILQKKSGVSLTSKDKEELVSRASSAMEKDATVEVKIDKVEDPSAKIRREQKEIVKKYGWQALEDLAARMNMEILIKKP